MNQNIRNIYSSTTRKGQNRMWQAGFCSLFALVLGLQCLRRPPTQTVSATKRKDRCRLKRALQTGEFRIFSHRSYYDNARTRQPDCRTALSQLQSIGVDHLDLDLVLSDDDDPRLLVAHPMEYRRASEHYSPCSNIEFSDMMEKLVSVYGKGGFFVSLEPKAAWGQTGAELADAALTSTPSSILRILLEEIEKHELGESCGAIVSINPSIENRHELEKERELLDEILQHCQLMKGIRLSDEVPTSMGEYDLIMPTIEFHPSHVHNTDGKVIAQSLQRKSIFWVVDTAEDLALAAEMTPFGIVSNSPRHIVEIVNGDGWCNE